MATAPTGSLHLLITEVETAEVHALPEHVNRVPDAILPRLCGSVVLFACFVCEFASWLCYGECVG